MKILIHIKEWLKNVKKNKYLEIILLNKTPSRGTFRNFLNNSDNDIIHRVFISTLVILNNMNALSISRVFIDGTDAIIRGSRFYFIRQRDLQAMDQINQWGLLHDGSPEEINKTLNELNIKLKEFKNDEEMIKLINLSKRRIKIFKKSVYEKKDIYEREFEKRGDVKLSIIFPESVYLKTKQGRFDFGFNFQAVMTDKHIIFTSMLLSQPNDQKVLENVYYQIKKTLCIFLEMQCMYGNRENYLLFIKSFLKIIIVADAGYFTIKNLYFIFINKINAIIMPNTEARKENKKLKAKDSDKEEKISINDKLFKRVKGGYACKNSGFLKFIRTIPIKHRKPTDENLPDVCKN